MVTTYYEFHWNERFACDVAPPTSEREGAKLRRPSTFQLLTPYASACVCCQQPKRLPFSSSQVQCFATGIWSCVDKPVSYYQKLSFCLREASCWHGSSEPGGMTILRAEVFGNAVPLHCFRSVQSISVLLSQGFMQEQREWDIFLLFGNFCLNVQHFDCPYVHLFGLHFLQS